MDVLTWILSGLLAAVFLAAGLNKLAGPRERLLANPQMGWVEDLTSPQVKAIATLEVLGAVGVVVPWLVDVAPVLSPVSALGLGAIMLGALVTHRRRGELAKVGPLNGALLVLAVGVAVLRFAQL
ncbi:DoxX family protein [Nocardioides dilutus]